MLMTKLNHNILIIAILFSLLGIVRAQDQEQEQPDFDRGQRWIFGILTGIGISLIGFVAALIVICLKKCLSEDCYKGLMCMLFALACGALVGDAFVHLIPEAFKEEEANSRITALIIMCSILFFLILENLFRSCGISHNHYVDEQEHSHQHGSQEPKRQNVQAIPIKSQAILAQSDNQITSQQQKTCCQAFKGKHSSGYLNLLASFIHNFFDGLAVGFAWATGFRKKIATTTIAVVAHQIPRQMGDVGILLKSGFTPFQTACANGLQNIISLIGVIVGLAIGTQMGHVADAYISAFIAGNFLYIGADIWRNLFKQKSKIKTFLQFFMLCVGVGAMYLVLLAEKEQQGHDH